MDFSGFSNLDLCGGFVLRDVKRAARPMTDAIGRGALARTTVLDMTLIVEIGASLKDEEASVSLYHEVLEAATVAARQPPAMVLGLNEAGFEAAALRMQSELGSVSPGKLNRMLEILGF